MPADQTLARQIAALRRDLGNMHANLERVCQHLQISGPLPLETPAVSADLAASHRGPDADFDLLDDDGLAELSPPGSPSAVQAPMDAYLAPSKDATPGGGPGGGANPHPALAGIGGGGARAGSRVEARGAAGDDRQGACGQVV